MNDLNTHADLNILPLVSYNMLIGIDWLEKHIVMLNCYDKTFTCIDDTRNTIKVKEILIKVMIREIYALQMETFVCKGCKVFVVYVMDDKNNDKKLKIEGIAILKEIKDIFSEEVLGLPLKREIEFIIDMILGAVPASKVPHRMNIIKITELKS